MFTTTDLPFPIMTIAGMPFTVFNNAADADHVAVGMMRQNARDGITGTDFVSCQRSDGKFLVAAIETADEVCWFIPAAMVAA